MHISSHGELNYICPSSNIYGICLFFFPHFFLPEPASESHHMTALNQINVTERSKWGGGGEAFWLCRFYGNAMTSSLVSLIYFLDFFPPFYCPSKLTFFLDFYTGTKEDERDWGWRLNQWKLLCRHTHTHTRARSGQSSKPSLTYDLSRSNEATTCRLETHFDDTPQIFSNWPEKDFVTTATPREALLLKSSISPVKISPTPPMNVGFLPPKIDGFGGDKKRINSAYVCAAHRF